MPESKSEIQLVITGEHKSAADSLEAVSKLITDITESIGRMASKIAETSNAFADLGRGLREAGDAASAVSGAMTRFGKNVGKQASEVAKGTDSIVKSMGDIGRAAETIGSTDATLLKDFSRAVEGIGFAETAAASKIRAETAAVEAQTKSTKAATSATRQYKHDQMLALIAIQMMGTSIAAVGYKGAQLFVGAIKGAASFQALMSRVGAALKTTGGDTQENIKNLSALAIKLDQTSLYSMNDIADMMQALAKQGLTYKDIYGGAAKATITLAQATDTSLTDTGTVITDVMHEFNLKGSQMTPVINAISGALHQANIKMTDFYNTIKYVGPLASQLGLNVKDVAQAIGLLAQHGIKGTQAGTTLRRMLMDLQPSTKKATAEFQQLGLITKNGTNLFYNANGTLKDMGTIVDILHTHLQGLSKVQQEQALRTMFGVYALSGMEVVANTTKQRWDALTKSMSNTSAVAVAAEKMNNLAGHWKEFTSTLQTLGISMATFMLPILDKLVLGLQKLAGAFKNIPMPVQHAIFIILGLGSALTILVGTLMATAATVTFMQPGWELMAKWINGSGLIKGVRGLASSFGLLSAAEDVEAVSMTAALGPIALIIAALAAIGVAVYECIKHWKAIQKVVTEVWNFMWKNVIQPIWKYIEPTLTQGMQSLHKFWNQVWPEMRTVLKAVWDAIKVIFMVSAIPMFIVLKTALAAFQKSWKYIWQTIKDVAKLIWDEIVMAVKIWWDIFSGVFKIFFDLLTGNWKKAWTDLKTMGVNLWNDIKAGIGKIAGDMGNIVMDAIHALVAGVEGAFGGLVKTATTIWNSIVGIFGKKIPAPTVSTPPTTTPSTSSGKAALKIPHYASGGIAVKPQIAMIGENGPEAVIPLTGLNQQGSQRSLTAAGLGGGGLGGKVVNINGPITIVTQAKDAQGIGRALKTQFSRALIV